MYSGCEYVNQTCNHFSWQLSTYVFMYAHEQTQCLCSAEVVHDTDLTSYLFYDGENLYKADYCTAAKDSQALVFPSKETHTDQELALRAETKTGHV